MVLSRAKPKYNGAKQDGKRVGGREGGRGNARGKGGTGGGGEKRVDD